MRLRESQARAGSLAIPAFLGEFIRALDGVGPLPLVSENVIHRNSIQVMNAERYVYSSDGDFGLVREMLKSNPELKGGPRCRVT
jgi:hypothetical protein